MLVMFVLLPDESVVCQPGQFLLNSSCLHECPPGYFGVNQTNNRTAEKTVRTVPSCIVCHPTCVQCSGPEPSHCLQCAAGRNLTSKGICLTTAHRKAWWSAVQIGVFVIIACLFVLPVVVCVLVQVRNCQLRRSLSRKYSSFIVHSRSDNHIPIEVSIDKPLLDVSSSDSEDSDERNVDRH